MPIDRKPPPSFPRAQRAVANCECCDAPMVVAAFPRDRSTVRWCGVCRQSRTFHVRPNPIQPDGGAVMTAPSVLALIHSVCAAYALHSGRRPTVVRLGTDAWDEFEAWAKGNFLLSARDPLGGSGGRYRYHSLWVGRMVNVERGIAVEEEA